MEVSVVICTYNRARSLGETLDALAGQQVPAGLEWELIVVDNNSSDDTRGVIEGLVARATVPMRYLFEPRQGLSHARNTGLAAAGGAVVAFTDDDVRPGPDWVATIAQIMRESGADVLGGRILPSWERPPQRWLLELPYLRGHLAVMEHEVAERLVRSSGVPAVWGANMAFRRQVFDRVGRFDPDRGIRGAKLYRGEELDLVDRVLAFGGLVIYDPRSVVWHRVGPERARLRYFMRLYFERAEGEALRAGTAHGRRLFGVPGFRYRAVLTRTGRWLIAMARRDRASVLDWLAVCEAAGAVWGAWKRHRRVQGAGESGPPQ